ncbi:MAG: hypothetical protein JNL74_20970, partial [Fibrobacteres bacterium]|nr:hypothetical protein [Fibrobacterota bacterium]
MLIDWSKNGEIELAAASNAIKSVKIKIDDYFARCKLVAYDNNAVVAMNRSEADYQTVADGTFSDSDSRLAAFPLAKIEPNGILHLINGRINPAWENAINNLVNNALVPLLDTNKSTLTFSDWNTLQSKVASYDAWIAKKPILPVEELGLQRLSELLSSGIKEKIFSLIEQDSALEGEFSQMASVTKLLRFQKDLFSLLKNFVNFSDFYEKKGALFQTGTLYLDNRSCNLCISIQDVAKHATLAGMAGMYIAYCNLSRPGGQKQTIAAVFSDGDSDNLMEGRNGLFYDRKGLDWDATIVKVISNPISVREAFLSPYKKFIRMIEEQVAKRAAASNAEADSKLASTATVAANIGKIVPPKAEPKKIDIGTVAALGVAFGAISTAIAAISTGIMGLRAWQMVFVPVGIMLLISGPSMLIAALKLRKRNLGPILDANGWAINNVARINFLFGASLTGMPSLPVGSTRILKDPYAETYFPWIKIAIVLLILFI